MRMGGALFVSGILARLSPDSARTKHTMANIIPSQKIARTAFDLFIVLFLLLRASLPDFFYIETESRLTLCDSAAGRYCAGASKKGKQNLWVKSAEPPNPSQEKGNATVTSAVRRRSPGHRIGNISPLFTDYCFLMSEGTTFCGG